MHANLSSCRLLTPLFLSFGQCCGYKLRCRIFWKAIFFYLFHSCSCHLFVWAKKCNTINTLRWDEKRNYPKNMQRLLHWYRWWLLPSDASDVVRYQCFYHQTLFDRIEPACLLRDLFNYGWKYVFKSFVYWHQTQFSRLVVAWLETNAKRKIYALFTQE